MSESIDALKEFWNCLEQRPILVSDIKELQRLLGNAFNKIQELELSREKWRAKYQNLKNST